MKKTNSNSPPSNVRLWMRELGFISEDELAEASRTSSRYRNNWSDLKPVQLGLTRWFRLRDIKVYLNGKADQILDECSRCRDGKEA